MLEVIKNLNLAIRNNSLDDFQKDFKILKDIIYILGLTYNMNPLSNEELNIYNEWEKYRNAKDFEKADVFREKLVEKGVHL